MSNVDIEMNRSATGTPTFRDGRSSRSGVRSESCGGLLERDDLRHYKPPRMPLPGSTRRKYLEKTQLSTVHDAASRPGMFSPRADKKGARTVTAELDGSEAVTLYHGVRRKSRLPLGKRVTQVVFNRAEQLILTVDGLGISEWRENTTISVLEPRLTMLAGVKRLFCALQSSQYVVLCDGAVLNILNSNLSTIFSVTSPHPCSNGEYNQSFHNMVMCGGRSIQVWNFVRLNSELKLSSTITVPANLHPDKTVSCVHLEPKKSRSQRLFAVVHRSILVYTLHTKDLLHTLRNAHTREITCVLFNRTLSVLCSASRDGTVNVWDGTYTLQHSFCGHSSGVVSLQPYPHGPLVISASSDETIRVWNLLNGLEVDRLPVGHPVQDLASHANVEMFVSISSVCLDTWKMTYIYHLLTPIDVNTDDMYLTQNPEVPIRLVLHSADSAVRLVSPESGDILTAALLAPETTIVASVYEAQQERLYVLTGGGTVERFDTSENCPAKKLLPWPSDEISGITALCLYEFVMDKEAVLEATANDRWFSVALDAGHAGHRGSMENTLLLAGNNQGKLLVIDQRKKTRVAFSVKGHSAAVHHFACSPKLDRLASGSREDRSVCIWRVFPYCQDLLSLLQRIPLVHPPAHLAICQLCLCVVCNNDRTSDYSLTMFDLMSDKRYDHSPDVDHADGIISISALDSLGLVATASTGGDVRVWTAGNELVRAIHLNAVPESLAFCSYQGDLVVGIQGHLYKIGSSTYLPQEMLKMTLAVSMAVSGVEYARPMAPSVGSMEECDRRRLVGIASSAQRYTPGDVNDETASQEDTEEWREEQLLKRQMEAELYERDLELEQLRDGTFVYERERIKLTAKQKKAAWKAYYNQTNNVFSRPNAVISSVDTFDFDGSSKKFFSTELPEQPSASALASATKFFPPLTTFEPPYPVAPSGYLPNSVLLKEMRKSAADQAAADEWKLTPLTEEQLAALSTVKKPIVIQEEEEEEEEEPPKARTGLADRLKNALLAKPDKKPAKEPTPPPTPPPEPVKEKKIVPKKPIVKLVAPKAKPKTPPRTPTPPREPTPPPPPEKIPEFIRRHLSKPFMKKSFPDSNDYTFPAHLLKVDPFIQQLLKELANAPSVLIKMDILEVLVDLAGIEWQDEQTKPMLIDALMSQVLAIPKPGDSPADFNKYQSKLIELMIKLGVPPDNIVAQLSLRYITAGDKKNVSPALHQLVLLGLTDERGYYARELDSWTVDGKSVEGLVKASQDLKIWLTDWSSKLAMEQQKKGKSPFSPPAPAKASQQQSSSAAINAINYFVRYTIRQEELERMRALKPPSPRPPPPKPPTPEPQTMSRAVVPLPDIGITSLARYGITHCSKCHVERESTLRDVFPLPPINQGSRHRDCVLHGTSRIRMPIQPKTLVLEDSDDEDSGIGSQASSTASIFDCKKYFVLEHTLVPELRRR